MSELLFAVIILLAAYEIDRAVKSFRRREKPLKIITEVVAAITIVILIILIVYVDNNLFLM